MKKKKNEELFEDLGFEEQDNLVDDDSDFELYDVDEEEDPAEELGSVPDSGPIYACGIAASPADLGTYGCQRRTTSRGPQNRAGYSRRTAGPWRCLV